MGRKSGPAQADNPGVLHPLDNLVFAQVGLAVTDGIVRCRRELTVVVDHNAFAHSPAQHAAFFNGLYRAGAARIDVRGHEPVRFRDLLSDQHCVSLLHNSLCGFADVLLQGEYHLSLRVKQAQPCLPAQLFMLFRMNAAAKSVSHSLPDPFPIQFLNETQSVPHHRRSSVLFYQTAHGK